VKKIYSTERIQIARALNPDGLLRLSRWAAARGHRDVLGQTAWALGCRVGPHSSALGMAAAIQKRLT